MANRIDEGRKAVRRRISANASSADL